MTLFEINQQIKNLKEEIRCYQIGHDFYETSPLFQKHQKLLYTLEKQKKDLLMQKNIQKSENSTRQA